MGICYCKDGIVQKNNYVCLLNEFVRFSFSGKCKNMNNRREKIWNTLFDGSEEANSAVASICSANNLSPITAKLLYNRGYKTSDFAKKFLSHETSSIYDPFDFADMDKAVERIKRALDKKEKIVIYGDYDVDGVTSVSCLYLYLSERGADVSYYIPSREGEGYGVSCAAIERFENDGVALIITVDTGITANEEVEFASSLGIDMVITDHHECREELPRACAVVNPHRPDCMSSFKEFAGVGVVFKLLCAFESRSCEERGEDKLLGIRKIFREYADLAAIGTIADVMPIVDENRLIVTYGLEKISTTERKGLKALIEASSNSTEVRSGGATQKNAPVKKKKITSSYIGYGLAPRINAAGRISNASKAVELFLTDSEDVAASIAAELCDINRRRQIEENKIAEQAYDKIEKDFDFKNGRVIVLEDDAWQQGVIGIVASRVTEKYGLPSILISFDGADSGFSSDDDIGKGSGRSIKGLNLVEALGACSDSLVKYGGHELAAGLTLKREQLESFKRKINEFAKKNISDEMMNITLDADCDIEMRDITLDTASEIGLLEPFGTSNPVPAFIMRDVKIERIFAIGAGKHTKLILSKDGKSVTAMCFGTSTHSLEYGEGDRIDVFFNLDINEYQNIKSVQLIVKDIRTSKAYCETLKKDMFRYEYIRGGGEYDDPENVIPSRDDFASVYNVLRRESSMGHDTINEKILYSMLKGNNSKSAVSYIKMKFIMQVFTELNLCGIEETDDGYYRFEIYFKSDKANLDKSYILKKLRSQCREKL